MGGQLTGALAGAASQVGQIAAGIGFGRKAAKDARKHQIRMFRNRYQWAAQDLEAAGLNRILALTKGPGQASAAPQAQTPSGGDVAGAGRVGGLLAAQLAQIKASTAKTVLEAKAIQAGLPRKQTQEKVFDQVLGVVERLLKGADPDSSGSAKEFREKARDLLEEEKRKWKHLRSGDYVP